MVTRLYKQRGGGGKPGLGGSGVHSLNHGDIPNSKKKGEVESKLKTPVPNTIFESSKPLLSNND